MANSFQFDAVFEDGALWKHGGIGHVNLIWAPVDHFSSGIEYMWGEQRASNNVFGIARRVQAMVKYEF